MSLGASGLAVTGLTAGYGAVPIVSDVNLRVEAGEVVALLGLNGAGKSTSLRAIAGLIKPSRGTIEIDGVPVKGPPHIRCREQLGLVLEGRSVFSSLTTEQNLAVGGVDFAEAAALFPALGGVRNRRAGLLSGGEQQMVALARSVLRHPRVLMIDELSLGLAPKICAELYASLVALAKRTAIAILIVEQHVGFASTVADRAYVLHGGRIALHLEDGLTGHEGDIENVYLARSRDASDRLGAPAGQPT